MSRATDEYYARCREAKGEVEGELGPALFNISYVGNIVGGWTMIWYWGKKETGFASGRSIAEMIASADRQVFRGL